MLTTLRFLLHVADRDSYEVVIMPADRMRAERASTSVLPPSQRGANAVKEHSETWVLLWLWCASKRLGHTDLEFEAFADTMLEYDRLTDQGATVDQDTDPDDLEGAINPTRPGDNTLSPSP